MPRSRILDEYAMVVVDEAHGLRNAITRRADALRELLAGSAPKDLVLLTATPVNNSLYDLYTLISYFVPNDAAFADAGVPSLRGYFDRAMAMNPDDLSPEHLFDVIDQVAVRRTRRFVKHHYVGDKVVINGVEQEIRFPTPRVLQMTYDLDEALPGMFGMLATALGAEVLESRRGRCGAVLLDAPGEVLSLARYVPSRFLIGGGRRGAVRAAERRAAPLGAAQAVRVIGVRVPPDRREDDHQPRPVPVRAGPREVLTGDALREWASSDAADIDEFLASYAGGDDNVRDACEYRVTELRAAVEADRGLLQRMHDRVRILAWNEDPKVIALTDALAEIAADADARGNHAAAGTRQAQGADLLLFRRHRRAPGRAGARPPSRRTTGWPSSGTGSPPHPARTSRAGPRRSLGSRRAPRAAATPTTFTTC